MCGIIRPIKAIGPTTAVALPQSTVMASSPVSCVRATRLPRAVAVSLPRLRLFSARLKQSATAAATLAGITTTFKVSRVRISSEPACQKRSWSYTSGLSRAMPLDKPSSTAASATPASVKRTGLSCPPPWLPVNATTSEAASAPQKAITSCSDG